MWSCGYLASRRTAPVGRLLASLVLLLTVSNAFAYDGVTFGLQVATPASGSVPLTANVVVPVATLTDGAGAPVGLAVRGDVSYALGASLGPSAGMNLLLSDASAGETFARPYLGLGAALGNDAEALIPTAYGLVGWRAPLGDVFAVRLETIVNVTVRSAALQLGFDFSPWGAR